MQWRRWCWRATGRKHFDPALQEIAAKRLRDAKYEPRVSSDPFTRPTSPAPSVSAAIEWEETIENIPLQLNLLKAGTKLQTLETWKDGTEPTTYAAECVGIHLSADGWDIELLYDRQHETNKEIARAYPDVEWGTLRLHLREDLTAATARFVPDNGTPAGEGTCTILRSELYANLTRAQVNVLLRPGQAALRDELLRKFGRCAVSNESATEALEAAHIIEHSAGGSAETANAVLLRADLHALFDAGKLNIDVDGLVTLVGLPSESRYHSELATNWNKRLPKDVLMVVRQALVQRLTRRKPAAVHPGPGRPPKFPHPWPPQTPPPELIGRGL